MPPAVYQLAGRPRHIGTILKRRLSPDLKFKLEAKSLTPNLIIEMLLKRGRPEPFIADDLHKRLCSIAVAEAQITL